MSKRQGQGNGTRKKENTFGYAFSMNRCLSSGIDDRFSYWHLDMNAGCGWNDKANCQGSPLVFLENFRGRNFRAYFCDSNRTSIQSLEEIVLREFPGEFEKCKFLAMDNRDGIGLFFSDILESGEDRRYCFGSILSDPNGNVRGANYESIADFSSRCPRIDIMLNWSFTAYRRTSASPVHNRDEHNRTLLDVAGLIHRPCWHVHDPFLSDKNWFIIAIGRNKQTRPTKSSGWFDLSSEAGNRIALECKNGSQPTLFVL